MPNHLYTHPSQPREKTDWGNIAVWAFVVALLIVVPLTIYTLIP